MPIIPCNSQMSSVVNLMKGVNQHNVSQCDTSVGKNLVLVFEIPITLPLIIVLSVSCKRRIIRNLF